MVPSYKVRRMSVARFSPHHLRKKSAIVRLSFRRRSYEGDEMTEMSESTKALSSTYPAVPFKLFISISFMLC